MQLLQRPHLLSGLTNSPAIAALESPDVREGLWTVKKCFDTTSFNHLVFWYLTISCPCIVCVLRFWCWSWWWSIVVWFFWIWSCSTCTSNIFELKYLISKVYNSSLAPSSRLTRAYSLSNSSLAVPSSLVKLTYPTQTQQTPFIIIGDLNHSFPGSFSKSQNSFGGIIPWTFSNANGKKWSLHIDFNFTQGETLQAIPYRLYR